VALAITSTVAVLMPAMITEVPREFQLAVVPVLMTCPPNAASNRRINAAKGNICADRIEALPKLSVRSLLIES